MNSLHLDTKSEEIQPMNLSQSILHFGGPTALVFIFYHYGIPFFEMIGLQAIQAFLVAQLIPMSVMFAFSFGIFTDYGRKEFDLSEFRVRYRFPRLTVKAVVWGVVLFIVMMLGYGLFGGIGGALIQAGIIPIPGSLETVNSLVSGITGRWDIVVLYFVMLFFNITGEELWWRGYVLPRQEKSFGKNTWIIHGLMWTAFHAFKWWDMIGLLPVCLALSYVSQRNQNNWPAYIAHYLFNGLGIILVIQGVLG
jgi:membrane protease YdiL (CAAX protease family)